MESHVITRAGAAPDIAKAAAGARSEKVN